VAEDAVWLGLLICAYRPGGGAGAGLVVIAGLLPAVALAPLTAAALAPTPGTVYQHNREPFLTVVLGYAAADRRAGRIAEMRVALMRRGAAVRSRPAPARRRHDLDLWPVNGVKP
jgi:hypothetical protein